ncbi:glycosyltransferase [Defluviitalea raffinosedens]|uniref:Glycosyltransferase n=1 Tax=Defluviitalea raffinosedens TaxID=1450156 RepID=A0A7C8HIJ6_9FIRM|nr:glycosyltransferase family 2 protein [Defluviitalea raffinosedens]KAE9634984.1 glycosyltransferase [Defluviitalea raffinosedens]
MDKISVLIPTFNVENYIEEAVISICNQTYKNIEIIIVDDCSTDNTFEILKRLKDQDNRIKLFRNEKNMRICYTLNKALNYSTGNYIARMDGDDISLPDRLEKQINFLRTHPEYSLVGTSTIGIDKNGNERGRTRYIGNFKFLKLISLVSSPVPHIWVAKREIYDHLGGYREMPYVEDYDFLLRMITSGFKFSNMENYYGYKVRNRDGNTATTVGVKQRKAFNYARKLYLMRRLKGQDNFSIDDFKKYIEVSDWEEIRYQNSLKLLNKAIDLKSKNNNMWFFYALKSIMGSYYQFQYVYRALLFRIIRKIYDFTRNEIK